MFIILAPDRNEWERNFDQSESKQTETWANYFVYETKRNETKLGELFRSTKRNETCTKYVFRSTKRNENYDNRPKQTILANETKQNLGELFKNEAKQSVGQISCKTKQNENYDNKQNNSVLNVPKLFCLVFTTTDQSDFFQTSDRQNLQFGVNPMKA